jgi:hypothetical protein
MKAITIWQPWASLLACGAKQYETRSWKTDYRGPIAIHAAKKDVYKIMGDLPFDVVSGVFAAFYKAYKIESGSQKLMEEVQGHIIATAELVNCWHIVYHPGPDIDVAKHIKIGAELDVPKHHPDFQKYMVPTEQEMLFGDWTPGRYAWEFANIKILSDPIPAKGQQRLWNWENKEGS